MLNERQKERGREIDYGERNIYIYDRDRERKKRERERKIDSARGEER